MPDPVLDPASGRVNGRVSTGHRDGRWQLIRCGRPSSSEMSYGFVSGTSNMVVIIDARCRHRMAIISKNHDAIARSGLSLRPLYVD